MNRRFLFLGVGVLAILVTLSTSGQLYAQRSRGGSGFGTVLTPDFRFDPPRFYRSAPANSGVSVYTSPEAPSERVVWVNVHVPADAEIWFDGNPTRQRGQRRTYVSPPLDSDTARSYEVRARWLDGNGRTVDQTRVVAVRAGQLSTVEFLSQDLAKRP